MTWIKTNPASGQVRGNDQAILQITLIASWFNSINRVADASGVGRD